MPLTTFKVTISNIRCPQLPPPGAGRARNAFVKLNFDNFKSYETKVKNKDDAPEFPDTISFQYATKYADCLTRKMVYFEVHDFNRFTSNELLGVARLDLHTVATGPVAHSIALRDGRKTRGSLLVDIVMTQVATVELRVSDLLFQGVPPALQPQLFTKIALRGPGVKTLGGGNSSTGSEGAMSIPYPDAMFLEGTVDDIMQSTLDMSLCMVSNTAVVASAELNILDAHSFVTEKAVRFEMELVVQEGFGAAMFAGHTLLVSANLIYTGFPIFAQMKEGLHGDGGITNAVYPYPNIPMKPGCHILMKDAVADAVVGNSRASMAPRMSTVARASIAPGSGGGGLKTASKWKAAKKAVLVQRAIRRLELIKDGVASDFADQTVDVEPAVPLTERIYNPGKSSAPILSDRLFAGAAGMPVCWIRRLDPANNKVAFENLTNNFVETELPTEAEYVVSVPPTATGPLGLSLEPNFSGMQRYGWRSGRRNSGFDLGATVRELRPDGYLAARAATIRPGHHLISINGTSTLRMTFDETVGLLKNAGRPLVLRFHDPFAVSQSVASSVSNPAAQVPGTWVSASRPLPSPAAAAGTAASPLATTAAAVANAHVPKRVMAQAQQALDLALAALAKVDVHTPLVQAKESLNSGIMTEAIGQAQMVQQALADPGFIRSITTVVTGVTADSMPASQKSKEEEKRNNSQEDDDDAASPPTETPQCADKLAERALRVMSILTATDDKALHSATNPAYMEGVREKLKERAVCMAEMGVFRRTMESINNRASPAFAKSALKTVTTIMNVYGLAPKDLGLGPTSLIGLQSTMKKENFGPISTEAETLVSALADENPDQNGKAFIQACIQAAGKVSAMTLGNYYRSVSEEGKMYYILPDRTSTWVSPPVVTEAMDALMQVNRRTRLLDDGAVVAGPVTLFEQLAVAINGQLEDPFVASVLVSAVGKLAAHPTNAAYAVGNRLLAVAAAAGGRHPDDARMAEGVATLFFNVGRDLDQSENLLDVGAVGRVCYIARTFVQHTTNAGGMPCNWAPAGREEEVWEGIVYYGNDKYAREKNAVRPRLVRICVNVLINLACYRNPTTNGETSINLISRSGAVSLLGEILRLHISEASVVTSVLNCAANIAFKNRDIQMALGETIFSAVVQAGYQFSTDTNLLSMALRTIGNLTNQDANIYRALGFGAVRMISSVMKENAGNVSLQNLAASVLSNVASVEAVDDITAQEFRVLLESASHSRDINLPCAAADAAHVDSLLRANTPVWSVAAWVMLEEEGVLGLTSAMTMHSTDVSVVEACLRTLMCVAGDEQVAHAMVDRFATVGKTLFVMRAADFDVGVQLAGATLLQLLANNANCLPAVTNSDAAHSLALALETHKVSLFNGINQATAAINSVPVPYVDVDTTLGILSGSFEGKPLSALQLVTRIFETFQLLPTARAAKSVLELNSLAVVLNTVHAVLSLLNTMTRRGFPVDLPPSMDAILQQLVGLAHAGFILLSMWAQGPVSSNAGQMDELQVLRMTLVGNERVFYTLSRLTELCTTGTGEQGDPSRPAVQLKAARALIDCLGSCLFESPVLPGKITAELQPRPGGKVLGNPRAVDFFVRAGGLRTLGVLMLAYTTDTVRLVTEAPIADLVQATVRMLTSQLLVLIDCVGAYTQPSVDSITAASDPQALANDPLAIAAGMVAATANAMAAMITRPGVAAMEAAPAPIRLIDLADLSARVCGHLTTHLMSPEPFVAGGCVLEQEAAAIFCVSLSRVKQQLSGATVAHHATPIRQMHPEYAQSGYSGPPPNMGAGVPISQAALPPPAPLREPASSGSAAPSPGTPGKASLKKMSSRRGLIGRLGTDDGVLCTWWHDAKARQCILRVTSDLTELCIYDAKAKMKARGMDGAVPTLAKVSVAIYRATRVGSIMVGGKMKKQTGMFKSGPKPEKSVCLDTETDTLLQFEFATAGEAEELNNAFTALLNAS